MRVSTNTHLELNAKIFWGVPWELPESHCWTVELNTGLYRAIFFGTKEQMEEICRRRVESESEDDE